MVQAPAQVNAFVRYRGSDTKDDGRLFSPGANDMPHMDTADIGNTEQPGSGAGECLCPISWSGCRTLPTWRPTLCRCWQYASLGFCGRQKCWAAPPRLQRRWVHMAKYHRLNLGQQHGDQLLSRWWWYASHGSWDRQKALWPHWSL